MRYIKCIAFDCFGTVLDMSGVDRDEIRDYVEHVKRDDFSPFSFPPSWWKLKAHPDAAEGITELRKSGFACIALSNGGADLLKHISDQSGVYFDRIIDLPHYQIYKPHVDAYRTVQIETGFTPSQTLMVTANPTFGDLEGSAAIGMPSKVIRQPGELADINELCHWITEGWE